MIPCCAYQNRGRMLLLLLLLLLSLLLMQLGLVGM